MTTTLTYSGTLVVETCWCGMTHAVPQGLVAHQQQQFDNGEKQTAIYCPLGHSWIRSGKGRAELAEAARLRAERDAANAREDARALNAQLIATKGQLTKAKNRAKGGACPCCNRTFVQLSRHIATKHPEFAT